jgi:hypothetical protein
MNGRMLDHAIELATWIEDGARRLLRQAALGELGDDLSTTADETLITTGLEAGDAEIMVYAEEDFEVEIEGAPVDEAPGGIAADIREAESYLGDEPEPDTDSEDEDEPIETRILEPIPAPGEIKVTATHWLDEVDQESERGHSLEWPAPEEERDLQHREKIDTPRVRHLFPVPDSDWEVSHLEFEYRRR